jgi:hypothetical protein
MLQIVDAPPAATAYNITVTKAGYSTDQTYVASSTNPTPSKPPATVVAQQLTAVSFQIDKLSALSVQSVTPMCVPVPGFHFNLTGAKIISNNITPAIPKYSNSLVTGSSGGSSGILNLNSMEWDSYTVASSTSEATYDLAGINPPSPFALNPNNSQNLQLVVVPKNGNSLMVSVVDNSGLPIPNASVELKNGSGYDVTKITGQGSISQTDWSGGNGQEQYDPNDSVSSKRYWWDDANVGVLSPAGDIKLRNAFGAYNPSGYLESSSFDTGTTSNFYNLVWLPGSQSSASTSVKFQFATSASSTPTGGWQLSQFTGPDGTNGTFYTNAISSLDPSSLNLYNGNRYARYLMYATSSDSNYTPDISDVGFTYTSGCIPPGQVIFQGLSANSSPGYTIAVSKSGYQTQTVTLPINNGWQDKKITLLFGP